MREASSSSSRLACCTPCGSPSMRTRLLFSLSGGMRTDTLYWSLILFTEGYREIPFGLSICDTPPMTSHMMAWG